MKKEVDERIKEGVIWWFGQVKRMENDKTAKRIYVGECAGSRLMGGLQKKMFDNMKHCLRKRGLDIRQARRMVQD